MNEFIENKTKQQQLQQKTYIKLYRNNGMGSNLSNLQSLSQDLSELIAIRKEDYNRHLANELNDPQSSSKILWKILKTFYNGKKIPLVPPIIVNDKYILHYKEKANHFNNIFTSQCIAVSNDFPILHSVVYNMDARLSSITCEGNEVRKILISLDISKAHGLHDISI